MTETEQWIRTASRWVPEEPDAAEEDMAWEEAVRGIVSALAMFAAALICWVGALT